MVAELVFLGTGGGRYCTMYQKRHTGGLRINSDINIHIDPGPGALIRSYQHQQPPWEIDLVCVTHRHTDHVTDTGVIIEAMTNGGTKKRGHLAAAKSVLEETDDYPPVSKYHQGLVEKVYVLEPGGTAIVENVEIEATKTTHSDHLGIGFKYRFKEYVVSYTGDTGFSEEMTKQHKNVDYCVLDVIFPTMELLDELMTVKGAIEFLNETRPKHAIITHFGMKMLKAGPEEKAAEIEKETGVPTLAARDGMRINLESGEQTSLEQWE